MGPGEQTEPASALGMPRSAAAATLCKPLPRLKVAQHHTSGEALHRKFFTGPLVEELWDVHAGAIQARRPSFSAALAAAWGGDGQGEAEAKAEAEAEDELVVCSENTVSHRLFEHVLRPVQQCVPSLLFGDAKIRGPEPKFDLLPDVVGYVHDPLDQPSPDALAEADGELKHFFNYAHSYHKASECLGQRRLRQIIAQPVENMLARDHRWCWWSSYEETALFRLVKHGEGHALQRSPMIPRTQRSSGDKASLREILVWAYRNNGGHGTRNPAADQGKLLQQQWIDEKYLLPTLCSRVQPIHAPPEHRPVGHSTRSKVHLSHVETRSTNKRKFS